MSAARLYTTLALLACSGGVEAATCSCAGAPVLIYLDTRATERGEFYLSYTAEDHEINDLVSGSKDINDETGRDRNSFSQIVSASYALTDQLSFSALVSYVEHNRTIGASIFGKTSVSGLGDSVLLARYTPVVITPFSRHEVSLGLGARVPTGENEAGTGFLVSEDMQPGVGAYGWIGWASYSYAFDQAATLQFHAAANHTYNEENDRKYAFGNESNLVAGISQRIGARFAWSATLRYRDTEPDRRFGFEIPNTGGRWLDFMPTVSWSFTDRLSAAVSGRVPVARDLNGALQFTTSYSYAVSLSYGF